MTDTAKEICTQALLRSGFGAPASFAAATDTSARQMWAILRSVDNDIRKHDWQERRKEFTFTTVAGEEQIDFTDATDFPDEDFGRFVPQSIFNRSQNYPLTGPLTASQWQRRKATNLSGIFYYFTVRDNKILFLPEASAGETIAFEYISKFYWQDASGTEIERATADTDTPILDPELYILGCRWRWLQNKRLDYAEALRDYTEALEQMMGATDPGPVLNTAGNKFGLILPNVPEGNWPS